MSHSIVFGTDGWRAIIAEQFTFANVERVAYAIGLYCQREYYKGGERPPVLIGYDTRFLADQFARRAAEVLMTMGLEVKMTDRDVPTPVIALATQVEKTCGAIQLTASHNPPEYCGMKYIPHYGGPATNGITDAVFGLLNDMPEDFKVGSFDIPQFSARPAYMAALEDRLDWDRIKAAKLRIAVDTIYSTSRDYLDAALMAHGVETKSLHNWRDPLFGGGMPEPKPEYLLDLIATVKAEKFDAGLATDGDGDRFGIIDDLGNYMSANQLLCLLTRHLVKNHNMKGVVVRTVATTHLLDRLAENYGLELQETPVGFKYVGEVMRQKDVLIGGEESGGFSVKGHIPEKDGILANLSIVEMMAYEKKPLSEIWRDLQRETGYELTYMRLDMKLTQRTQRGVIERLLQQPFKSLGGHAISDIGRKDGVKLYVDSLNWMLVRPSGTEPLLRLYCESTSEKKGQELMEGFVDEVNRLAADLDGKTEGATAACKATA